MSLLQRKPIDVHASIGCERAPGLLYRTNTLLLTAGQSIRPFAGAIVRSALSKSERIRMLESDKALAHPQFLDPINRAVDNWWSIFSHPQSVTLQALFFDDISSDAELEWHSDQDIRHDGLPHRGPITAIAVLEGSMKYRLSVGRRSVFNANNADYFADDEKPINPNRGTHEVVARAGDVLTFTNIPGTWHAGEAVGSATRAIYMSNLGRNPVE